MKTSSENTTKYSGVFAAQTRALSSLPMSYKVLIAVAVAAMLVLFTLASFSV